MAGPHSQELRGETRLTRRRVDGAHRRPSARTRIVPRAALSITGPHSSPHDHFGAGPDGRVVGPWSWRALVGQQGPAIRSRIVAGAVSIQPAGLTTPHDHLAPRPDRRMPGARFQWRRSNRDPSVVQRVVPCSIVQIGSASGRPPPDNHLDPGPNGAVPEPRTRSSGRRDWRPAVDQRVISCPVSKRIAVRSSPNQYLTSRPNGRVPIPSLRSTVRRQCLPSTTVHLGSEPTDPQQSEHQQASSQSSPPTPFFERGDPVPRAARTHSAIRHVAFAPPPIFEPHRQSSKGNELTVRSFSIGTTIRGTGQ
jgi:hypothetical protein